MVLDGFQMRNGYPKREQIFPIFRAQVPLAHRAGRTRAARKWPFLNILTSGLRETPPGMVLDGFQMRNGYPKREPIFPIFRSRDVYYGRPVTGRFWIFWCRARSKNSQGRYWKGFPMRNRHSKREPFRPFFLRTLRRRSQRSGLLPCKVGKILKEQH